MNEPIILVGLTEAEKTTPPTTEWAKEVCMIGHGARCCRFICMGVNGWSCEKHSNIGPTLTFRAETGLMGAVSDNCEGRASQ
jgi:hypothetical protein